MLTNVSALTFFACVTLMTRENFNDGARMERARMRVFWALSKTVCEVGMRSKPVSLLNVSSLFLEGLR